MRLKAIVAALAIILFSPSALALSLGEAQAQSHLNQPLKATIRVTAVNYDERDTIRAIIPDAKKFQRAGIRRDDIVDKIRIDIADGASDNELLIHLRTEERIQEPFLNFLVEVRWLGGSVIREYTLLLDPASVAENRQPGGSQDVRTRPLDEPGQAEGGYEDRDEPPVYSPSPSPSSARIAAAPSGGGSSDTYGPVKRHETLWSIALSQRRDPGISMDQMQLAIYQANPQAFEGNINRILAGSMLTIPPDNEIRAIEPDYAKREIARQKRSYAPPAPSYQPAPAAPVAAAPEPEPEPESEPEPTEEVAEPEPEVEPQPVEPGQAEVKDEIAEHLPSASNEGSELPPDRAAAPATADGQALTQDELMAEGEVDEAAEGDIEMPSMWAGEEGEATQDPGQAAEGTTGEVQAEPVVDEPPPESTGSILDTVNLPTLLLGLLLILVLLATYWWYRRKRVVNVGSQFAYAGSEETGSDSAEAPQEGAQAPKPESAKARTTQVWQDYDDVPASIDEYVGVPGETSGPETQAETVELEAADVSPIRDISSEEIDYLGEADVHLAYGLYDEAASVLQRGINENPRRDDLRLKLLEVYHSANQSDEFVDAAEEWQRAGVQDTQAWQKAVQLGQRIAPAAPLFKQAGEAAVAKAGPESEAQPSEPEKPVENLAMTVEDSETREEAPASEIKPAEKTEEEVLDFDLSDFDLAGSDEAEAEKSSAAPARETSPKQEEPAEEGADELSSIDFEDLTAPAAESDGVEEERAESESSEEVEDLDFDLGDISIEAPVAEEEAADISFDETSTPEEDDALGGLRPAESRDRPAADEAEDIDLGALEETDSLKTEPAFGDDGDTMIADEPAMDAAGDEEISVKLDLARAYLDMGEPEMARTLLDEVVDMGNEQQRQEAQELLSRAG